MPTILLWLFVINLGIAFGAGLYEHRIVVSRIDDEEPEEDGRHEISRLRLPNGSRLSCGRNARRRKEVEPQTKRLAGEGAQFFPHERPPASSAC